MSRPAFTLPQLATHAGLEYRTAHVWQRRGLVVPSVHASEGTGHPSLFDVRDVVLARALAELRAAGLNLDALDVVNAALRERPTTWERIVRVPLGDDGHHVQVALSAVRLRVEADLDGDVAPLAG